MNVKTKQQIHMKAKTVPYGLINLREKNLDILESGSPAIPVLKPDLNDPHVQASVGRQLLPDVPGRLRARLVGVLEDLHLAGRDGRPRPLVAVAALAKVGGWGVEKNKQKNNHGPSGTVFAKLPSACVRVGFFKFKCK